MRSDLLDKVRSGQITQADAARASGVSRQAVHQRLHAKPANSARQRPLTPELLAFILGDSSEAIEAKHRRSRNAPVALANVIRQDEILEMMFSGLQQHYMHALASGRIEVWKKAAISCIELMADVPELKIERRAGASGQQPPTKELEK